MERHSVFRVLYGVSMSERVIEVTRGKVVETIHRGDVAIVDLNKQVLAHVGDSEKFTYLRSAAKPIQALEIVLSGAFEHYQFSLEELAITCASHYAEPRHLEVTRNILKKIGLDSQSLLCGNAHSINYDIAIQQALKGEKAQALFSDCSGKHSGMLAICQQKGYPIDSYLDSEHPMQKKMKQNIAVICDFPEEKIEIGIDGCSVPVFAISLSAMAFGFARMANPLSLPNKYQYAANLVFDAMTSHPFMVAGTGGFCTELMKHTHRRLIGKIGAEGVYCVGIKEEKIGIAVKIENGNLKMLPPMVMEIFKQMNLLSKDEFEALKSFHKPKNKNQNQWCVGEITPCFQLTY